MRRRRVLNAALLLAGLAGIAWVVAESVTAAQGKVLPSLPALFLAGLFAIMTILSSARAWVALFSDLVDTRARRAALRGTFYLSQLTKYVPVGGVLQAASQLTLARSAGVPTRRIAVAFPVSVIGAVAAGGTLGAGLVFDTGLSRGIRVLALFGSATVLLLHRGLMARAIQLGRRYVKRIPDSSELPTQRDIFAFYGWALLTIGAACFAYSVLLLSVTPSVNGATVFCAFAVSWVIGFLAVPIPAGVGVREAMLIALVPGVGAAPLLAASLALRLLSIGAEILAFLVNKLVVRHYGTKVPAGTVDELNFP
jgi:uncharacterized membrane protein YbhN (UPF0104 family)